MKNRSFHKHFALLLSLLIILGPISTSFAGGSMDHANMKSHSQSVENVNLSHEMTVNLIASHHQDNTSNMDENSCKAECANCVFCSATGVTGSYFLSTFDNNTHHIIFKSHLQSIDILVDIRPPINA